jgi:hypothetical protein
MDNWNNNEGQPINQNNNSGYQPQPYQNNQYDNHQYGSNQYYNDGPLHYGTDKNAPETEEEKRKGNFFSGLSLACTLGGKVLSSIAAAIMNGFNYSSEILDNPLTRVIGTLLAGILGLSELAGFILMIYVRVKYPKNTFGKVLMWLYIIWLIMMVIAAILVIATCVMCVNELSSCPG